METQAKPRCKLSGTDGNVFALAGLVGRALRRAGLPEQVKEFSGRLFKCRSYEDALALMAEYVDVE